MKHLLRYVSTTLRAVLLLGVLVFANIQQSQAQTEAQWAELPDAFESMDPTGIIDDGQYYYIQFYQRTHDKCSYLTDCGLNKRARSKDFIPFANNRLWTLVSAGDDVATHFKLKNKDGHYIRFASFEGADRFGCVEGFENGSILSFNTREEDLGTYYDIYEISDDAHPMYRPNYVEWADLARGAKKYTNSTNYNLDLFRLRFVKLKTNSAFIIYYRGEGPDNSNPNAVTTRHYLTYSGTGNQVAGDGTLQTSDVSSRTSVYRSDEPLCKLPTLASYHKDGLWTLEPSGEDGGFYIKKYGTNDYLLNSTNNIGVLGAKDELNGKYKVEDTGVNRYTPIMKYDVTPLTADMFKTWSGYDANATVTGNATVDFHVGDNAQIGEGAVVAGPGDGGVFCQTYADLSDYERMVINGTPNMLLRLLMSRQESDSGPWVEKQVTIDSNGNAEVDLTNLVINNYPTGYAPPTATATVRMTYVSGSDGSSYTDKDGNPFTIANNVDTSYGEVTTAVGGYNTISGGAVGFGNKSWDVNNIIYLQVDASAINGDITRVTLNADVSGSTDSRRITTWGVGYNNSVWSSGMTWNTADKSITTLGETQSTTTTSSSTYENKSFDITGAFTNTDSKVVTILVYETAAAGGNFTNPTVTVEYNPSVSYAHLNAIKTWYPSATGTINSITLVKKASSGVRYLHYSKGDGWQVEHWTQKHTNPYELWDAAFFPVEVPATNEDNDFQVLLKVKKDDPSKIKLTGATKKPTITPLSGSTLDNLYGATFTPTADLTNVFKIENMPTGCYEKIVINFGSAVPSGWYYHAYGPQGDYYSLEGKTQLEITLDPERTIDDFTIFNWFDVRSSITINEVYFTPDSPSCTLEQMLNHHGGTDAYSELPGQRKLWHLEQDDDYQHFRLKAPNGQYFQADGTMTTDRNSAKIFTVTELLAKYDIKWFYVSAAKEIYVDHKVIHRMSYMKDYLEEYLNRETTQITDLELEQQGLVTSAQSDWWNYDSETQKVNHFEITHYVKQGESKVVEFPTILNNSSDHIYYQRWYHYNDETCDNTLYPDGSDIEGFMEHVNLDTNGNGQVRYYVYNNGIVTGEKLYWEEASSLNSHANRNFYFTNSDGKAFTVTADVSRYSDMTYQNEGSPLDGDLEEPSLTMRYIFYMRDAKEMATRLTAMTDKGDSFVDSKEGQNFLEAKTFHFPMKQIFYENQKMAGYRGEFIGLRHVFSDYWVFDGNGTGDANLVSAVNSDNRSGKIEVKIYDPNNTGIRLGGYNPNMNPAARLAYTDGADADYQGFYFYDMMDLNNNNENKMSYGDSRFIVFRYPESGKVDNTGKPVYINVYLKNGKTRYQLAQFTVIFDPGTVTLPYKSVNGSDYVKADENNTAEFFDGIKTRHYRDRDPKKLIEMAGKPIAKVTFDYPANETYHYPSKGTTRHDQAEQAANGTIENSSPIPLTFDKTNYAFDGGNCNWGSYSMVTTKNTVYGNNKITLPANDNVHGYGDDNMPALHADEGLQKAFLYIDASEQPGDICSAPFVGDFCTGDILMFSGWITGSNKAQAGYQRCPGGITLTVKGEHNLHDANGRIVYDENGHPKKETVTLYRFCPGQIYELDNGTGEDGSGAMIEDKDEQGNPKVDDGGNPILVNDGSSSHVVWQQFYFEFKVTDKYERHWIEVNNNCVSSRGGDFMLDNIAVYAIVPEVEAEVNTPLCVSVDESGNMVTDMRLLKLTVDYNKLRTSANVNDNTTSEPELGFMFLDKQVFLTNFRQGLTALTEDEKHYLHLDHLDFNTITLDELSDAIDDGEFNLVKEAAVVEEGQPGYNEYMAHYKAFEEAYAQAFDAAILGEKKTWHSNNPTVNKDNPSVLYFEWKHNFSDLEPYTFEKAVNLTHPVYGEVSEDGERYLVINGNFPQLSWKANTDYYIMSSNDIIATGRPFVLFNLCSDCTKANVFRIDAPYELVGLEKSENSEDYLVCEGQIPTLVTNLKGYDLTGKEVTMTDINFDWWLGDKAGGTLATLANYHEQHIDGIRLDRALSTLRIYYPETTTLDGITSHPATGGNPELTTGMVNYLRELVEAGQLVLHQSSISIPAEPAAADDPYFYLVACPIHDGYFDKALHPKANEYVAYFCDEPQGLRVKIGEKAPTLKTGFVPNQNGFTAYNYPADDPILSIRLAKRAQFMTVQHGESTETPVADPATATNDLHFLWLPVRDAQTQTADGVIRKAEDYNIYLASTNDPVWDKNIYTSMKNGVLPIVGKIVSLYAKNTYAEDPDKAAALIAAQNALNRLCVYFTTNFEVREGYTYTLSLPFQEEGDVNTCDGTMLINLKIVPDYEVWTGGADNTDWNNDENWRRADGNTAMPTTEPTDESKRNNNELLVTSTLPEESGLYDYKTNYWNYRTPKDRILRKGFAPLYCTHILMKSNEWGDAPVLYDALNGKDDLDAYPFPNLNESYMVNTTQFVGERYESIEALEGKSFAIFNEAEGKAIYGINNQNLGYANYYDAVKESNSGYYFKLESTTGGYLLRMLTPAGNEYSLWGEPCYLNSQPTTGWCSFVLGLGSDNTGRDEHNHGIWILEENAGKFALKNLGTGLYLRDATPAKYDEPTYFTFCTLEESLVPTEQQRYNILKFDMQARVYDIWSDTYGSDPDRGRSGDLIAEMYQINSCDEIAFQPSAELLNAHLLNYNNAWVEYQLDNERWYLLGSSLQGTVAGEWYSPTGTAQQKTTYYEPVTFGAGYDRYSPAIYQRSWDKAKAVLYEVGSTYSTSDDSQTENLGNDDEGVWTDGTWTVPGGGTADQYLDRLGYKPMGGKKANVAIKGVWSNTYNDATVDYANGGFSVMVKNALKNPDQSGGKAIIRLPKEDTMYDYYKFEETGQADGGTDTDLGTVQTVKNRALNRGRLKSDLLLPTSNTSLPVYQQIQRTETSASRYGDQRTYTRVPTQKGTDALPMTLQEMQETVATGVSDMGYYLVENPFQTGLDMETFFAENTQLLPKYWIMTPAGQQLVYRATDGTWITQTGEPTAAFAAADAKLAPGQGFFVQKDPATTDDAPNTISFTADMQAKTRYGVKSGEETFTIVVGTKQKMTTKEETITLDDGTTQTVTVEVPEVDDSGNYVVQDITEDITISSYEQATGDGYVFPLKARCTRADADEQPGLVVTAQRGSNTSSALVMKRESASDDFLPSEDTETFISMDELKQVPMVYTLCGRLATTINSIRQFRSLPLGVESASDAPCTLTFEGVEQLGDSVAFYDAKTQELTPLESGMTFRVSGRTQNRYYLVSTLIKEEAAAETHVQIFVQGLTARVIASTDEPIVNVRCYDTAGRLVHAASPQTSEYSFTLPAAGIYIIEAHTANDHKTIKVSVN